MKNKFLNISIGVTMMLLGAGFLVRSINRADALPRPENFIAEGTNTIGKYMFLMYNNADDGNRRCGLVWDTQTGKSLGYFADGASWSTEKIFPENPLGQ